MQDIITAREAGIKYDAGVRGQVRGALVKQSWCVPHGRALCAAAGRAPPHRL